MDIKIGDTVRYLNDVGGGKVASILPDNRVMVIDDSGFEIPMFRKELVVVDSDDSKPKSVTISTKKEVETPENYHNESIFFPQGTNLSGNNTPKAYIAIVPQNEQASKSDILNVHIVNDCNYHLFVSVYESNKLSNKFVNTQIIAPNKNSFIYAIDKNKYSYDTIEITVNLSFYSKGSIPSIKPWQSKVEIETSVFTNNIMFKRNSFFDIPAVMYRLVDTDSSTAEFKKALETLTKENSVVVSDKILLDTTPAKNTKKEKPKENFLKEVDLHIQSLVESTAGLTPKEMLDIQMRQFKVEFENALAERYKRVVFIHGLGNGTLKNEIRRTLDREYKKYEYHDASFKEYGFGATMVILSK